jgi:hypothetical protein
MAIESGRVVARRGLVDLSNVLNSFDVQKSISLPPREGDIRPLQRTQPRGMLHDDEPDDEDEDEEDDELAEAVAEEKISDVEDDSSIPLEGDVPARSAMRLIQSVSGGINIGIRYNPRELTNDILDAYKTAGIYKHKYKPLSIIYDVVISPINKSRDTFTHKDDETSFLGVKSIETKLSKGIVKIEIHGQDDIRLIYL